MVGRYGVTRQVLSNEGSVLVGGEMWSAILAKGQKPLKKNEPIEVSGVEGVKLVVKRRK